jgi:hypothetical protein
VHRNQVASIAVLRVKVRVIRSSSIAIAGMMNAEATFSHGLTRINADQSSVLIRELNEARREFWTGSLILMLEEDVSIFPLLCLDPLDPRFEIRL